MKKCMYSILDCVSNQYSEPFCFFNDSDASRMFSSWIKTNSAKYPDGFKSTDYKLFCVGSFDSDSGFVSSSYSEIPINLED